MNTNLLQINPKKETQRIIAFLKNTLEKQNIQNVVIGLSGGIDSTTSFYLLTKVVSPEHIFPVHLSYFPGAFPSFYEVIKQQNIPEQNIYDIDIKDAVDAISNTLKVPKNNAIRQGNIMARIRMVFLYDLAKKHNALVCGTENRSEHLLGYFTRFGDEASDIEPIRHLYKTQVCQLAKHLGVPQEIIEKTPTADLWEGQTDEKEFGFSYQEADQILFYYFEQKLTTEEIVKKGFTNADKIIQRVKENEYKHETPYTL